MISSILPFSSKRKSEKISSSDVWEKDNSDLQDNPSEDTFTTGEFEDIVEEDPIMKRLSIVVGEIEEFEREFVHPVRKTVSSSNVFKTSYHRHSKSHLKNIYRYSSVQTLCGKLPSSSSSVISDYDSGAFSRESTPDFSLMSSIPDVSEAGVNQFLKTPYNHYNNIVQRDNHSYESPEENIPDEGSQTQTYMTTSCEFSEAMHDKQDKKEFDTIVNNSSLFSSTPKMKQKNVISKSDSFLWARTPTALKRSATSAADFPMAAKTSESSVKDKPEVKQILKNDSQFSRSTTQIRQEIPPALKRSATSASSRPVNLTTLPCAVICKSEVTVNGLCYHLCK